MAQNFQYCVAECWGKGFITHEDSSKFQISGFPGNVWQVPAFNRDANVWINGVAGVRKTKNEAQAIVDAIIQAAQAEWDNIPADDPRKIVGNPNYRPRPVDIALPE